MWRILTKFSEQYSSYEFSLGFQHRPSGDKWRRPGDKKPILKSDQWSKSFWFNFLKNAIVNLFKIWSVGANCHSGRLPQNLSRIVNIQPGGATGSVKLTCGISPGRRNQSWQNLLSSIEPMGSLEDLNIDHLARSGAALERKIRFWKVANGKTFVIQISPKQNFESSPNFDRRCNPTLTLLDKYNCSKKQNGRQNFCYDNTFFLIFVETVRDR